MNHIHRKSPFWSLAGPLLAYWGIQLAVQFIIQAFIQERGYAAFCKRVQRCV